MCIAMLTGTDSDRERRRRRKTITDIISYNTVILGLKIGIKIKCGIKVLLTSDINDVGPIETSLIVPKKTYINAPEKK